MTVSQSSERSADATRTVVAAILRRRGAMPTVLRGVQLATGLLLLTFGEWIGRPQVELLRHGARASGRIVAFTTVNYGGRGRGSRSAFHPIVEYAIDGHVVRFRDRIGSSSEAGLHEAVDVLYSPARPTSAMIDRPVWNWIPWAPALAAGAFLLIVGGAGLVRHPAAPPAD